MSRTRKKPGAAAPPEPAAKPGPARLLGTALLIAAAGVATFLAWHSWKGSAVPGCSEQAACHSVIAGRWGQFFGIPVSIPGAILYAGLALLGLGSQHRTPGLKRSLLAAGTTAVVAGALWFTAVQAFILHAFCPWCIATHALAVAGSLLVLGTSGSQPGTAADPKRKTAAPVSLLRPAILLPILAVGAFAVLQTTVRPPERVLAVDLNEKGVGRSGSLLSLHEGSVRLSPDGFPLIGSSEAEVLGVFLADFTCPHCRQLHLLLEEIVADDPARAAFVVVPAYRDSEAALLHRVLLTAWKENPNVFERFTTSLLTGETDPESKKVLDEVNTSFGGRFYEIAWTHAPAVEAALELGRQLIAANDATLKVATLPQLMIGAQILSGEPRVETIRALIAEAAAGGPAGAVTPLAATPIQPSASQTSGPKIEFVTTALDLPETVRGETARGAFRFRNTGDATLQITKIKPACGCTAVAGWDQPVPPGAEGSFSVQLDTARFMGNVTKSIDVMSNAVNAVNGVTKVSVTAHIWLPVRLQPSSVNFGTVLKGKPAPPKSVEVTVTDAQPLDIGAPVSSHPAFSAQLEPVEPGRTYKLTVAFTPPENQLVAQGELTLPLNHPRLAKLTLPLYARSANAVEVIPRDLTLPQAPLANPQERVLTVQCHDTQHLNFAITGIEVSEVEGVTAQLQSGPPTSNPSLVRIKVTIPAGLDSAATAAAGAAVEVKTNHPAAATVRVPFKVFERRPVTSVPGRTAQ